MSKGKDTPIPTVDDPLASFDSAADEELDVIAERFQVISKLGQGGMGRVFRAHDKILDRDVAVKLLNRELCDDHFVLRFQQEARAASQLKHPNILCVLDFGLTSKTEPFLVMEWVDGESLDDRLKRIFSFSPAEAVHIIKQLALAMQHAHRNGVVHRDLKPSNIMLTGTDRGEKAMILDFGIAKLENEYSEKGMLTLTGQIIGSPRYLSPEQARGESIDGRSDIYSLGCVMFELLTGQPPYSGETAMATISMHLNEPVPRISDRTKSEFPGGLEEIVMQMMAKNAGDRPATMGNLYDALEDLDVEPISVTIMEEALEASSFEPGGIKFDTKAKKACVVLAVLLFLVGCLMAFNLLEPSTGDFHLKRDRESVEGKFKKGDLVSTSPHLAANEEVVKQVIDMRFLQKRGLRPEEYLVISKNNVGEFKDLLEQKTRAFHIRIHEIDFTEHLMTALEKHPNIKELRFQSCTISPAVQMRLCNLPLRALKYVHMPVHTPALKRLQENAVIEDLQFYDCNLTDADVIEIARLNRLNSLELCDNKLSESAIKKICTMSGLTNLQLENTGVKDKQIVWFSNLKNLQSLNLSKNSTFTYAGLKPLSVLKNLKHLRLEHDGLDAGCFRAIVLIPNLQSLDVSDNDKVDVVAMEHLRRKKNLQVVAARTKIEPTDMLDLSKELGLRIVPARQSDGALVRGMNEFFGKY